MKKLLFPILLVAASAVILKSCINVSAAQGPSFSNSNIGSQNVQQVLFFNPEIDPGIEEIRFPSYQTFFDGVTQEFSKSKNIIVNRVETPMIYDDVDVETLKEICKINNFDLAVVPKIKYFKVGFGKYVLSNQVIVSLKMYNSNGELLSESSYDTYRKNKRILGSTENSIKIGTTGALNEIRKYLRKTR
ncbi:pyruvate decarboxylase [Chryseobacterium sp. A301]